MGRPVAARLHRAPPGVVAQPPDLRAVLARPELAERRPAWGAGKRGDRIYLEPLPRRRRWRSSSTGWSPGSPTTCARRILERAEGVPLYAVETVRMLLDRGLLVQRGQRLPDRPGPIESLEVPETLHALIAARLDGLPAGRAVG